jgi:lactoylglutathione lyase
MRISNLSPILGCLLFASSAFMFAIPQEKPSPPSATPLEANQESKMQFGNFSVSLTVKDIKASQEFYEKLDFVPIGGNVSQNWLIMQNGTTTIGLFQGMFEKNLLTFNPGWNHKSETLSEFQDVRELQATLKKRGIVPATEADPATTGPASFVIVDPDGNPMLVDQHVSKAN